IVTTGLAFTFGTFSWPQGLVLCTLSLLLGIWYLGCISSMSEYWSGRVLFTWGYLLVGWIIWAGLITLNPIYLFVLFGLYPQLFVFLRFPGNIVGACILLGISLWGLVTGQGGWNVGVVILLSWPAGVGLSLFIDALVRQSRERAQLIQELQATRQELALAARQAGIMQERQRLAREIHDTFTQGLSSIVMQIEAMDATPFTDNMKGRQRLLQVGRIARENLVEARRLLWALQPEVPERASLPEMLRALAERWTEETGVRVDVTITGQATSLRPEIEVTLLRAAQEALANIRKHAQASSVVLTLSYMEDIVALDIQDDGIGFDPHCLSVPLLGETSGRFGLKALRERIEQLEGTFTLETTPGEGTTIAVALPSVEACTQTGDLRVEEQS
ncbi:MAG TPA: sensor histidine kinase, partial [Ktedonobacteraceae bacterium]|nr:sensor histidine kinase [Ktedonobacteraceae bacterium]